MLSWAIDKSANLNSLVLSQFEWDTGYRRSEECLDTPHDNTKRLPLDHLKLLSDVDSGVDASIHRAGVRMQFERSRYSCLFFGVQS